MKRVNSHNDFGHDDSTIYIVVVIIIIITSVTQYDGSLNNDDSRRLLFLYTGPWSGSHDHGQDALSKLTT